MEKSFPLSLLLIVWLTLSWSREKDITFLIPIQDQTTYTHTNTWQKSCSISQQKDPFLEWIFYSRAIRERVGYKEKEKRTNNANWIIFQVFTSILYQNERKLRTSAGTSWYCGDILTKKNERKITRTNKKGDKGLWSYQV